MTSAGLLTVGGRYTRGRVVDVRVRLERPSVTQLFIGQLPEAVVKTVPYLFTLCATAQRTAAQAALAAATGEAVRPPDHMALWVEVLHENLWRLLLDWPEALGVPLRKTEFVAWRNARTGNTLVATTRRLWQDTVLPLAEKCLAQLGAQAAELVAPTPIMTPEAWLACWKRGETPPVQAWPESLAAAYRGRLAEIERALIALESGQPFPVATAGHAGWGIGQTHTARGVLTHAVRVHEGRVADYRVQAPTDACFADALALEALLKGLEFSSIDVAKQGLNQAILALDPCLPYVVELQDA